jgi:multicomponent Na+:H+ antiporter subunit D
VDEHDLRGSGKQLRIITPAFFLAALGLAGVPPFATFFSEHWIEEAARSQHPPWITHLVSITTFIATTVTTAAALRIGGRIFLGWGEPAPAPKDRNPSDASKIHMDKETEEQPHQRQTPPIMWIPAWALVILAITAGALTIIPSWHLPQRLDLLMEQLTDSHRYAAHVLERPELQTRPEPTLSLAGEPFPSPLRPLLSLLIAAVLALIALYPRKLGTLGRALQSVGAVIVSPLRRLQTGRIGDYVAWMVLGVAAYAIFMILHI